MLPYEYVEYGHTVSENDVTNKTQHTTLHNASRDFRVWIINHPETTTTSSSTEIMTRRSKISMWVDLPRRLATAGIAVPIIWKVLSHALSAKAFCLLVHVLGGWEFSSMESSRSTRLPIFWRLCYLLASTALLPLSTHPSFFHAGLSMMTAIGIVSQRFHYVLGLLFWTLPMAGWFQLISSDFASGVSIILIVWIGDTGALIAGRLGYKRWYVPKWIQRTSPAKSMEGFLGALVGGVLTAAAVPAILKWGSVKMGNDYLRLWNPLSNRLLLGFVLSILGIIGDLVESTIKRQSKSKDSGSIFPGHGGVLDKADSLLLAVLFYQCLLEVY